MMEYYAVTYSNSLEHHGVKGMKWGIRKLAEKASRYTSSSRRKRYQTSDVSARSRNKYLGRKINADYNTRRERGKKLRSQGRTKVGAVARGVGRAYVNEFMRASAHFALERLRFGSNNSAVKLGASVSMLALDTYAGYYRVSNIIRTYQDVADMNTYDDYKNRKANN